jgi:hypothetical protein
MPHHRNVRIGIIFLTLTLGACCKNKKDECSDLMRDVLKAEVAISKKQLEKGVDRDEIATKIDDEVHQIEKNDYDTKRLGTFSSDYRNALKSYSKYYRKYAKARSLYDKGDKEGYSRDLAIANKYLKEYQLKRNEAKNDIADYCK